MITNFVKAVTFTRLIKAGGRLREFNFRKFTKENQDLFSVDTVDNRGDRILFRMQRSDNNHWSITQMEPPTWIRENESLLDEAIETELHKA
ncbi:MAG TPA: hypothetical protein VGQ53_19985 [Chitinophagaceae bacterium]|jgi:hypothetical protein|nr:hypothetical protein [Chitinophagaceae bacterium]